MTSAPIACQPAARRVRGPRCQSGGSCTQPPRHHPAPSPPRPAGSYRACWAIGVRSTRPVSHSRGPATRRATALRRRLAASRTSPPAPLPRRLGQWPRPHGRLVLGEQLAFGVALAAERPIKTAFAPTGQFLVQFGERIDLRYGNKKVPAAKADQAFDLGSVRRDQHQRRRELPAIALRRLPVLQRRLLHETRDSDVRRGEPRGIVVADRARDLVVNRRSCDNRKRPHVAGDRDGFRRACGGRTGQGRSGGSRKQ